MAQPVYQSDYVIQKGQDLFFGAAAFAPPATFTAKRFTTCPNAANVGGVVATYTGYADISITNNTTNFASASGGEKHNLTGWQWPTNVGSTSEAQAGWGLYDGANLIVVGKYTNPITIAPGQAPYVAPGHFSLTLSNTLTTPANGGEFPSNYLIAAWLDHIFGGTAYSPPANHFLARYTVAPTAVSGSGTEAAYTAYARKSFANNLTSYAASAAQIKKFAIDVVPTAAGSGPTLIVAWAIYDALTTGNELLVVLTKNSLSLLSGETDDIPANALKWKLSDT